MPATPRESAAVLAVAAGNSHIAFLVRHGAHVFAPCAAVPTAAWTVRAARTWREIHRRLDGPPRAAVLGGVVPEALRQLEQFFKAQDTARVWRFRAKLRCPLEITPKPSGRVGDDRLAAALGALELGAHPWVIVDCGTALTVNAVRPARGRWAGIFEGGLIVPGEALCLRALHAGTAQLPRLEPWDETPAPAIGKSSQEAMRAGVRRMQLAAVEALALAQARELGPRTRLALTGGGARALWPALNRSLQALRPVWQPDLVCRGLLAAYERQTGAGS